MVPLFAKEGKMFTHPLQYFRYGNVWAPVRGPDDGIIHSSFTLAGNLTFEKGTFNV